MSDLVERLRIGKADNPKHEVVWVQNLRAHFTDGMFTRQFFPEWNDIFLANVNLLLEASSEAADALASQATLIAELQGEVERARKVISDHAEIYAEDGGGPTNAAITKAIGLVIRDIAALKGGLNGK